MPPTKGAPHVRGDRAAGPWSPLKWKRLIAQSVWGPSSTASKGPGPSRNDVPAPRPEAGDEGTSFLPPISSPGGPPPASAPPHGRRETMPERPHPLPPLSGAVPSARAPRGTPEDLRASPLRAESVPVLRSCPPPENLPLVRPWRSPRGGAEADHGSSLPSINGTESDSGGMAEAAPAPFALASFASLVTGAEEAEGPREEEGEGPAGAAAARRCFPLDAAALGAFLDAVAEVEVLHLLHEHLLSYAAGPARTAARQLCEARGAALEASLGMAREGSHPFQREEEETETEEDEFDEAEARPGPYPAPLDPYRFGEPAVPGTAHRVLPDGRLYRLTDAHGGVYLFNDTAQYLYMVRLRCVMTATTEVHPRAVRTALPETPETEITMAICPEETTWIVRGGGAARPSSLTRAVRVPDDYLSPSTQRCLEAIRGDIERVRGVLGPWTRAADQAAYLRACLQHGLKFTDLAFRPGARSLRRPGVDRVRVSPLPWRRPADYLHLTAISEARVFHGAIASHRVQQGTLRDHTVVAAIAAVARSPRHTRWLFRHPTSAMVGRRERAVGAYRVTLVHRGWWRTWLLDDYLPASTKGPLFAQCPGDPRPLWVSLLEKAYAKSRGSYAAMCHVDVMEAVADLTGFPTEDLGPRWGIAQRDVHGAASRGLFRFLRRCIQADYLVLVYAPAAASPRRTTTTTTTTTTSTTTRRAAAALVPGRVYFMVDTVCCDRLDWRLVCLEDPWTREVGGGGPGAGWEASVPGASVGSGAALSLRSAESRPRGTRWFPWEEALAALGGGGVGYTWWRSHRYRVANAFRGLHPHHILEIHLTRRVEGFVTMTHQAEPSVETAGERLPGETTRRYRGITFLVTSANPASGVEEVRWRAGADGADGAAPTTRFTRGRETSLWVEWDPGASPYHLIPLLDPADAGAAGETPFVFALATSLAAGHGELEVRFRQTAGPGAVEEAAGTVLLGPLRAVKASYQCVYARGVRSAERYRLVEETDTHVP